MPFIEDSHFEKKEKAQAIREQIMKKKEQAFVNDSAKDQQPKKPLNIDNAKIIKAMLKNTNMDPARREKPKVITLKDIKSSLQVEQLIEKETKKEIVKILDEAEIKEIKSEFVNLLAITHAHPIKRKIFANKLHESKTINSYVDNNLILRMFNKANENIKFSVVYAIKYLETNKDYDTMLMIQKMNEENLKKQPQMKQEQKVEEKVEEKEETEEETDDEESEETEK